MSAWKQSFKRYEKNNCKFCPGESDFIAKFAMQISARIGMYRKYIDSLDFDCGANASFLAWLT